MPKGVYPRTKRPVEERFWEKVAAPDENGCRLWTGAYQTTNIGLKYGRFGYAKGDGRQAHRVAYEFVIGPIPLGLQIDHVKARGCVSTLCCEPSHLEAVTQRENTIRGNGFAKQALKTECVHGHSLADALRHHGRRECRECCRLRSAAAYAKRRANA